jgi:hypothetical protein
VKAQAAWNPSPHLFYPFPHRSPPPPEQRNPRSPAPPPPEHAYKPPLNASRCCRSPAIPTPTSAPSAIRLASALTYLAACSSLPWTRDWSAVDPGEWRWSSCPLIHGRSRGDLTRFIPDKASPGSAPDERRWHTFLPASHAPPAPRQRSSVAPPRSRYVCIYAALLPPTPWLGRPWFGCPVDSVAFFLHGRVRSRAWSYGGDAAPRVSSLRVGLGIAGKWLGFKEFWVFRWLFECSVAGSGR